MELVLWTMDPQSVAFTPQSDIWRVTMTDTMRNVQATQHEHAERLMRLERRHDGDTRIKSAWSTASPFPSGLTGTPQTGQWPVYAHDRVLATDMPLA